MIRPEAVIGSFFLTGFAFWVVAWHEGSPLYTESDGVVLTLTAVWWSLGFLIIRAGAPALGRAWLYGSGTFVALIAGLIILIVFSSGS